MASEERAASGQPLGEGALRCLCHWAGHDLEVALELGDVTDDWPTSCDIRDLNPTVRVRLGELESLKRLWKPLTKNEQVLVKKMAKPSGVGHWADEELRQIYGSEGLKDLVLEKEGIRQLKSPAFAAFVHYHQNRIRRVQTALSAGWASGLEREWRRLLDTWYRSRSTPAGLTRWAIIFLLSAYVFIWWWPALFDLVGPVSWQSVPLWTEVAFLLILCILFFVVAGRPKMFLGALTILTLQLAPVQIGSFPQSTGQKYVVSILIVGIIFALFVMKTVIILLSEDSGSILAWIGTMVVLIASVLRWVGLDLVSILHLAVSMTVGLTALYLLYRARQLLDKMGKNETEQMPVLLREFLAAVTTEGNWRDVRNGWRWPNAALFSSLFVLALFLFFSFLSYSSQEHEVDSVDVIVQYPSWLSERDDVSLYVSLANNGREPVSGVLVVEPVKVGTMQVLPGQSLACQYVCQWGPLFPEDSTSAMPTHTVVKWQIRTLVLGSRYLGADLPLRVRIGVDRPEIPSTKHEFLISMSLLRLPFGLRGHLNAQPITTIMSALFGIGYTLLQVWTGRRIGTVMFPELRNAEQKSSKHE